MAKTKISELEAACGADRKDIIAFLNEKGIDAKTAGSSVDETAAALVMDRFGAGNAKTSAPAQDSDGQATRRTEQRFRGEILPDRQQKTAGGRT